MEQAELDMVAARLNPPSVVHHKMGARQMKGNVSGPYSFGHGSGQLSGQITGQITGPLTPQLRSYPNNGPMKGNVSGPYSLGHSSVQLSGQLAGQITGQIPGLLTGPLTPQPRSFPPNGPVSLLLRVGDGIRVQIFSTQLPCLGPSLSKNTGAERVRVHIVVCPRVEACFAVNEQWVESEQGQMALPSAGLGADARQKSFAGHHSWHRPERAVAHYGHHSWHRPSVAVAHYGAMATITPPPGYGNDGPKVRFLYESPETSMGDGGAGGGGVLPHSAWLKKGRPGGANGGRMAEDYIGVQK
eukprot:gene8590-34032_t